MSKSDYAKIHELMCQRLAAECTELAAGVPDPELRANFLRMASMWADLAVEPRVLH